MADTFSPETSLKTVQSVITISGCSRLVLRINEAAPVASSLRLRFQAGTGLRHATSAGSVLEVQTPEDRTNFLEERMLLSRSGCEAPHACQKLIGILLCESRRLATSMPHPKDSQASPWHHVRMA